MINTKTTKNLTQQIFILCLLCMTSCRPVIEHPKCQGPEPLVPEAIIAAFKETYSPTEMNAIAKDLANIHETSFVGKTLPELKPTYVATAGGPGACKTTILETYLHDKKNFVYIDPDQRALKYMINTYYQSTTNYEISKKTYSDVQKNAYAKWRDASNYIANTLLNQAFTDGFNIAHGTTSTSSAMGSLYKKLKQQNYKIVLLLCYATDETRVSANNYRTQIQGFVQATAEDIINKGKLFPERFPIYFEYADEIQLYWTEDFLKGSTHAATYIKNKDFIVHDHEALTRFVKKYDDDRKQSPTLPSFNTLVQTKKP